MATTAETVDEATLERALGGESETSYWQKRFFVDRVFEECRQFLSLKVHHSVRVLFKLYFDAELAKSYPLPSPALVRMRISRIHGPGEDLRCEWRIAGATAERSDSNISFDDIRHPVYGGEEHHVAWTFLEVHYGHIVRPYSYHLPHITKIQARITLREPLGPLAVLEGDSEKVYRDAERHYSDPRNCLTYVTDDMSLSEP